VKEKRTGNVNFGASMGQGTGVGGFIGLDQPNLFGNCKRGSLQWQFGRLINDFNLSYTDPSIQGGRLSGTVSAYRSQQRFNISGLGRSVRTGSSLSFGLPVPRSPYSRVQLSYSLEGIDFGTTWLFGTARDIYGSGNVRSTVGANFTRDTRIDLPFATAGGMETFNAQFSGGPLGGSADFQRYTAEVKGYAPLGQLGGTKPGSQPVKFVLGLTARSGALFGNSGAFFGFQQFALGGVQFGEPLRGYPEFSISPSGFRTGTDNFRANQESFGNAFFSSTVEAGMRVSQMFYANTFFDAGNLWSSPRQIFTSRLYRGAGVGVSVLTPVVGMLGIDLGYGFDRQSINPLTGQPRRDPSWQIHFRLGQMFQ
jgi:outer membrane protein insertion porin family